MSAGLPQLVEEDIDAMSRCLELLLERTGACNALLIDVGGFIVTDCGDRDQFDLVTLGALAAGAFSANEAMANIIEEPKFSSVYQQGENFSLLVMSVDESCHLMVIFPSGTSAGAVKYHAMPAIVTLAECMARARGRSPDISIDLAALNLADTTAFFKKQGSG